MKLNLAAQRGPANAVLVLLLALGACGLIAYCRLVLGLDIVSTHVAYLPIVLAGAWWGRRGIWVAIVLGALVLVFKLLVPTREPFVADVVRVLLFAGVALAVGTLSDRDARSRRELEVARARLQTSEKLASMGQLAAAVAHEINNPLGSVLLCSHSLLKCIGASKADQQDIEMIASEAARCRDIVRGLLDFARQSRVSLAPVAVGELLAEVRDMVAARSRSADVTVVVDAAGGLPEAMLDHMQVGQMLVNLADNAVDACRAGGTVRLRAGLDTSGNCLEISVSDDGCGMPRGNLDKLFTPFFTTKERGKGTGLGLAIAYGVVKMHRGEIRAESLEGRGTTLYVRLPLRTETGKRTE